MENPFQANLPPAGKRFGVPNIMQMEITECGAACLGMIFAFYKNWMPLEDLRIECGVNQHGANAAKLLAVARKYGFLTKGVRSDTANLSKHPFPMIIFWNYCHFVVLEGIKGDRYYINDPATGPEFLSKSAFEKSFSGVCLLIRPGPDFRPNKQSPPSEIKNLMLYISQNKVDFSFVCLVTFLLVIPGLCFPLLIKVFVDDILPLHQSGQSTLPFFMVAVAVFLCSVGLSWLQNVVIARFEKKLALSISIRLLAHILALPLKYFSQRFPGDIATRIFSVERLSSLISGPAGSFILISLVAVYALAMILYSPSMAMAVFVFTGILLIIFINIFAKRATNSKKLYNEIGQAYGVAESDLNAVETIQLNGNLRSFFERSNGWQVRIVNSLQREHIYNLVSGTLPLVGMSTVSILVLAYGGILYESGALSIGDLLAFQSLATNFMAPFSTFIALGGLLSSSRAHFNRINDVFHYPQDQFCHSENTRPRSLPFLSSGKLSGHIEIRNLTFGHDPNEPPLFENLSLSIKPQERIALLGPSGCGKSTLVELICGLQHPWSGQILFDGEELSAFPLEVITQSIAYVGQDIFLFDGTIRENLGLWNPLISGEDMIQALRDACLHDEVYSRSNRLDSRVVGFGKNFSGGERQRLELARALCGGPSILILDEATSALDPIVEASIEDNLRRRGGTCIVVAHRLSTIRGAKNIILLDSGKIVERGTHDELKERGGLYGQLLSSSPEDYL